MKIGEVFALMIVVGVAFAAGIVYRDSIEKMIVPAPVAVECDAACEFDNLHGKPRPPWLTETMKVVSDLGNGWWIIKDETISECLLMYRRNTLTAGASIGHFAVSSINPRSCVKEKE